MIKDRIKKIYTETLPTKYDMRQKHMARFKEIAIAESKIKTGDQVIVFCCGTGMDFPYIINKIGQNGKIIGIDFSDQMLSIANRKVSKNEWLNIDLILEDVTKFDYNKYLLNPSDVGICSLGISIIPDYKNAFYNLLNCVKDGGEVIIGDMQLAKGFYSIFNPVTLFFSKPFGGSREGHKNSHTVYDFMLKELKLVRKKEYLLKSYFIAWGQKP